MLRNRDSEHSLALLRTPGATFKVGRSEGSNLRLEHRAFPLLVSRNHAEFLIKDGRCILRNLNPLNGTYVSGRKLEGGKAVPISVGDVITFGGSKVVHTTLGQSQQCDNPHTFVVDGLEDLLPASPPLARGGSTQHFADAVADVLSQHSPADEHQQQPAAALKAREAAAIPPPPPSEDPGAAQVPATCTEGTTPQEQEQQLRPAAQSAFSRVNIIAGLPVLPPSRLDVIQRESLARFRSGLSNSRVNRPASLLDPSIIDLTELDDEESIRPALPPVPRSSSMELRRRADRRRLSRRQQLLSEGPVTLTDDEDVEILHDSQAAAEAPAPPLLPHSSASAPASTAALAKQGDWVRELEDEMSCTVCQESIVAAHSLVPCGHCFCGTCLFQWLSRKQICPTCRQPAEAPPVRSILVDNIASKSESGMRPEEVRDREQRKETWQALSDTAATAWKAMFAKPKRQRIERDPYPAYLYDALLASSSTEAYMSEHLSEFLEGYHAAPPTRNVSRLRRARQYGRDVMNAVHQRGRPAAQQPQEHAMVPPPPPPCPAPPGVRGAPPRDLPVLQPGDVLDYGPRHRPAAAEQLTRDSSGLRVEYAPPLAQPNHCLACRRGWQTGVPRLVSGTHSPIAWHLECYQLWPMLAGRTTSIAGIHRLSLPHQADIRRRLSNAAVRR